jgi:hypothetical protein
MTHEPPRRPKAQHAPPSHQPSDAEGDAEDTAAESTERPTVNPPFDVEAFARASASPSAHRVTPRPRRLTESPTVRPPLPDGTVPEPRAEQITLTNEIELEKARAMSAGAGTSSWPAGPDRRAEAPRHPTPGPLSMANARAPSAPNMPVARNPSPSSIEAAVLGVIGNAGPEIVERTIDDPIAEMRERFSLGDYTGALEIAELMLAEDPDDSAAAECAQSCRGVLEGMYAARLGPLDRVPEVLVQRTQLRWLSIDHRAGFVLSLIDGSSTLEMILDVCGMPKLDAIRILHELVQQKIVALKTATR